MDPRICSHNQIACYGSSDGLIPIGCISEHQFDCRHFESCECPSIKAAPEIAGLGVIAAFVIATGATLVLSTLTLILHRSYNTPQSQNPIDRVFRRYVSDPVRRYINPDRADQIAQCFFAIVMTISDLQLITGSAIVVAALHMLQGRTITGYHFNIVVDMAWFSSNTHLLSLLLMTIFAKSEKGRLPFEKEPKSDGLLRTIRAFLMVIMAILLMYCIGVTSYELWNERINCPARCLVFGRKGGDPLMWMVVNYVFILHSYIVRIIQMIPSAMDMWKTRIAPLVSAMDERFSARIQSLRFCSILYCVVRSIFLALWYFFASDFEFVLEMMAWYGLGLYWTISDRESGRAMMTAAEVAKEDTMGYAQFVPLFLLMLPLITMVENRKDFQRTSLQELNTSMASSAANGNKLGSGQNSFVIENIELPNHKPPANGSA